MKTIKKIFFYVLAFSLAMFIAIMGLATYSRLHIGQNVVEAIIGGWTDTADGICEIFGIGKYKADYVFDFKNGNVTFNNTHISW